MLSLDSLHTYEHVKAELAAYADLVSIGCYVVIEDTGLGAAAGATEQGGPFTWATRAALEFCREHPGYVADTSREKHLLTSNGSGWIRRLA
jgi:cephalosporin hydroxylase